MSYKPFVEHLVRSLVDEPAVIEISEEFDRGTRTFYVKVADSDVGKLIGKSGRVVSAVRSVVSAVAAKAREKAYVKVITE